MDKIPHTLGLDLVKQIDSFTTEVLDSFEEDFTWLNEILETAKIAFQSSQIQTLPKTPSAKKRKGRKRKTEIPSFIRRSSILQKSFDQNLNESHNAENVPPQVNSSHSYGTRNALRTRQKVSEYGDRVCNTSALKTRKTRNTRNNTNPESVPDIVVEKKEKYQVEKPEERVKMDNKEENMVTRDRVTEQNSLVCQTSAVQKETSLRNFSPPGKSPTTVSFANVGESRINNNSFVIETLSEEESLLKHPVISTSPAVVVMSPKPEITDTDSGVNSDEKEMLKLEQPESSECSDAKESPQEDIKSDTTELSSSLAVSSEKASQSPKSRTTNGKQHLQQQSVPAVLLSATYKESMSSTTSTELDEPPMRMTRSRIRVKQSTNCSENGPLMASTEDKVEETRTRTRTCLQKRKSDEMEEKTDSEIKRPCIEAKSANPEIRRSCRLSGKRCTTKDYPEDADVSDPDDVVTSKKETDISHLHKAPHNISTSRTFLNMNSSYTNANQTPSQKSYSLYKYLHQNRSLTSSGKKFGTQSRLNFLTGNMKSLLKRNLTPSKGTPNILSTQEQLEQRKREFEEKRKKEQERLMKREEMQKMKLEERKKKREERMLKVAKSRQLKEIQDKELKNQKNKQWEEKLSVTDRIREEKFREEREKLRSKFKKQQEVEERRNQEEEERARKLKEQEEENQRHQAMLQRKKEYEEQERQRKMAEEKRKLQEQRERMLEAEKERNNELERRCRIEEERERERLKLKEEREKEAARIRIECELQRHKAVEQAQREKLRELEQARLLCEQQMQEKKNQREQYISKILHQPSVLSAVTTTTLPSSSYCQKEVPNPAIQTTSLNTSYTTTSNHASILISPQNDTYTNYDINDLKSDDSTDEDDGPSKPVPKWASGHELKIALLMQYCNPPDLDHIFLPVELPDLNKLFTKKKSRFNKRTSSAVWDTPMPTSHLSIF